MAGAVFRTGFLRRKLVAPSISQVSEAILLQEATQHEEHCEATFFEEAAQHEFVWFLGLSLCVVLFLCVCFLVRSFVCLVGWLPQRFIRLRLEGFKVQDSGLWLLYASHAETTRSFGCCEKPKTL